MIGGQLVCHQARWQEILTSMEITSAGSLRNRVGSRWNHIGGKLKKIDSGPFGIVWGVNVHRHFYCRTGITWRNPRGSGWRRIRGTGITVSVGSYGVWSVNGGHYVHFRYGVSKRRPQGTHKTDTKRNSCHLFL